MKSKKTMDQREKAWDGCILPDVKAQKTGLESLTDSELVALVIRSGTRDRTALEVASELLCTGGRQLINLFDMSVLDMLEIEGIGRVKALQLKAVCELSIRLAGSVRKKLLTVDKPSTVADFFMERMRHEQQEILCVALFNIKGQYIDDSVISRGTADFAVLNPREIFSYAVRHRAGFVIMLHNHPSGIPDPSKDDNEVTKRIADCGRLLDIPLLDHIIIGDNVYYSYREHGLLG